MAGSGDKKHPPLSGEDAEIWARVAAQAEPLPALRRARHIATRRSRGRKTETAQATQNADTKKSGDLKKTAETVETAGMRAKAQTSKAPKNTVTPEARLDPKSKRRLARGTIVIDARLDLHGLTATQARARLTGFLGAAAQARHKWVLVITGKGRAGEGVLRRELPLWISQPPLNQLVIAYEPAAPPHGGAGAFYLRLRRA
ncbi:MAG: DNA mismatch repair protein MutS [Rhizobiales bacterium TMED83]|nr:DNA mismatch repair protein MutS [Rhodobiaceae bacterium]RPF94138.1 MAG: DNA mismatch repair protein MutS [Rhizobiales bacterium TMED83]